MTDVCHLVAEVTEPEEYCDDKPVTRNIEASRLPDLSLEVKVIYSFQQP